MAIVVLSFQGPNGGLVFPMNGVSFYWFRDLFQPQSVGALNTLPLELQAMQTNATTPVIYALGTLTTGLSILVITTCLITALILQRRRARLGSDAGKAV